MYRSEKQLSTDVVAFLRDSQKFVQRIESGTVGRGIPDLFVADHYGSYWFELKCARCKWDGTTKNIGWRAGQMAWMNALNALTRRMSAFTLVAYFDKVLILPMRVIYNTASALHVYHEKEDLLKSNVVITGRNIKEAFIRWEDYMLDLDAMEEENERSGKEQS